MYHNLFSYMRFEFFMTVNIWIVVFCVLTPHILYIVSSVTEQLIASIFMVVVYFEDSGDK
jgi:hypothetical protein